MAERDDDAPGLRLVGLRLTGAPSPPESVRTALLSAPSIFGCQSVELLLLPTSDSPGVVAVSDRDASGAGTAGVVVRRTPTVPPPPDETSTRLTFPLTGPSGRVGWLVAHGCRETAMTRTRLLSASDRLVGAIADQTAVARAATFDDSGIDRFTDALTGLRNRAFLYEVGPQHLTTSREAGDVAALFMLDLDDFKTVNDTLGHDAGDEALRQLATRLTTALEASNVAARLAGDEFVVLAPRLHSADDANEIARRIAQALESPLHWRELSLHIDASMGVALYPRDGESIEALMRVADEAMYAAKSTGPGLSWRGTASPFASSRQTQVTDDDLEGLRGDELVVHYQPQVDAHDGRVASFETLVRWQHPRLGLLEPADFLRLADRSGLMSDVTHNVLRQALQDFSALSALVPETTISVNMSARSLLGRGLVADISSLLREHDVPPARLVIEVNEPPTRHSRSTLEIFDALHEVGCQASVHDFGSGQVSLAVLGRYRAIREVKIDPTLVARVFQPASATMIRAMISMAHALGLRTVAEGIESAELADTLSGLQCDRLQGFFIAPPMALPDIETWLTRR